MSTVLTDPRFAEALSEFARPALLPGGLEPEERVMIGGVGWERYLAFDKALGDDRPSPRLYYLHGDLEIMTTSNEHERIKKWIADFMTIYFDEHEIETVPRGQATMRMLEEAGAEPDESWCIGDEKQWPDLVLEIALTSGGLRKRQIYRRFAVPELWFWRRGKLEVFTLSSGGSEYEASSNSALLPDFQIALLERCVSISSALQARRAFREGLRKG